MEQFGNTTSRFNSIACNQYKKNYKTMATAMTKTMMMMNSLVLKPEDSPPVITKSNDGHYLELVTSLLTLTTSFLRLPEVILPCIFT